MPPRIRHRGFFCRGCRYSLTGLETNVCPECGREFDPKDEATFLLSATLLEKATTVFAWAATFLWFAPLAILLSLDRRIQEDYGFLFLIYIVCGELTAFLGAWFAHAAHKDLKGSLNDCWRWMALIALELNKLAMVGIPFVVGCAYFA